MPVPKPVTMILPHYTPHKHSNKRKVTEEAVNVAELVFKHAVVEEIEEADSDEAQLFTLNDEPEIIEDISETIADNDMLDLCTVTMVQALYCDQQAQIKKKESQSCKKHSRCHCNLLSLDTQEFFSIKV